MRVKHKRMRVTIERKRTIFGKMRHVLYFMIINRD